MKAKAKQATANKKQATRNSLKIEPIFVYLHYHPFKERGLNELFLAKNFQLWTKLVFSDFSSSMNWRSSFFSLFRQLHFDSSQKFLHQTRLQLILPSILDQNEVYREIQLSLVLISIVTWCRCCNYICTFGEYSKL